MKTTKSLKGLILAATGSALIATGAMAADITQIMPPTTPTYTPTPPPPAFKWAGPYAGISTSVDFCKGWCWFAVNANVGYNFVAGANFLIGAQGSIGYWYYGGADGWLIGASARAGYIFGNVLGYAKVGYIGYSPMPLQNYYTLTGGLEVGLGHALSLFAEGGVERHFGGTGWQPRVEMGVKWAFRRLIPSHRARRKAPLRRGFFMSAAATSKIPISREGRWYVRLGMSSRGQAPNPQRHHLVCPRTYLTNPEGPGHPFPSAHLRANS